MSDDVSDYFVEAITNVSMANGVYRITFSQQDVNNTTRDTVKLLIPATKLSQMLNGIGSAAKEIEGRVKGPTGQASDVSVAPPQPTPGKPKKAASQAKAPLKKTKK